MEINAKASSDAIQKILDRVKETFADEPKIYQMFMNCYTNTLDTTVKRLEDGTTYVFTGDIPAMWLRDSTAQLRPYLIPAKEDDKIAKILTGLVKRQIMYISIDPYANAFNETANGNCWEKDETKMNDWLWERKYETDYYPLGQESVKTVQRADGYQPDTDFLFKRIYHRGTCGQQDGGKAIETCHTDGD